MINGGAGGGDTTTYAGRATGVIVTINNAVGDGEAGEGDDVMASTERVTGTSHDDDISGETRSGPQPAQHPQRRATATTLRGGDGADTVNGGDGGDHVVGNPGKDNLVRARERRRPR